MFEKRQKIKELTKDCFEARKKLIAISHDGDVEPVSCIKLRYSLVNCIQDPWLIGINPENTYRMVGPKINYCFSFDSKKPTKHTCCCSSCPMYKDYMKYISALETLQAAKKR